ncbi:hypothetical protein LMG27952_04772 [Paraburkholderia hiiakae]|uniref:Tyr recombinase domain-containing protein n=1 Tax=Paraburkholderia hiiakae TaxID=1081782 RepID=A0ABM8NXZ7_9BURK|nr:integrase family protein [Paraburkholderia hiiakae]CAD6548705.1 hypothetical protein LMG27952_04772 [Paraburkholderia hiiakae]
MAKVSFTAARVEAHQCPPGSSQSFLWDSRAPGLGLRATAAGAKSYIVQGKLHGRTVRVTIGDPRNWSIDKARAEAHRLQILLDAGKDPREERAEQRAADEARRAEAHRRNVTFGEAWDVYVEARRPRWSERHYRDHVQHADAGGQPKKRGPGLTVAGPLASLRPLKLAGLTAEHVAQWLAAESEARPTMVALSFRLLRGFIRWSTDTLAYRGVIPADAYKTRSVKELVPRVKAKEGDVLEREQLSAWFSAVRQIRNPVISAYLQALLLTGARREEMAGLRWTDVDFQWRSLRIADKVEAGGRVIPLPPYLHALLRELQRLNAMPPVVAHNRGEEGTWEPSPWVFASRTSADGKLAEPRIAHTHALEAGGLPHVSLHGLRRSFATLSEWVECPTGVVAQIQGHKPSAIAEKHYVRRPLDLLRKWHDMIEAWMLEQACVALSASNEVVSLRVVN